MEDNTFNKEPKILIDDKNLDKPLSIKNSVIYSSRSFNGYRVKVAVKRGYEWNGANIPRIVWTLTGYYPTHPQVLEASMIHDKLCENKDCIPKRGASISSDIFYDILVANKVPKAKAWTMRTSVYLFQLTQKGWN